MERPIPSTRRWKAAGMVPMGLAVFALALYAATWSPVPFPGFPAQVLVEQLRLNGEVPVLHPLWGMLVRGFDRLPFLPLAAWVGGFSALFGAACVGLTGWLMLRVRYRGLSADDGEDRTRSEAEARVLSAGVAGLSLACGIPFWVAATRSLPEMFHLLLLLLAVCVFSRYQQQGRIRQLAALGLVFGTGMAESATFLLYLPVAVLAVLRDEYRNGVLAEGRRHLAFGGGVLAGLLVYVLHAGWRMAFWASAGEGGMIEMLAQTVREQVAGLLLVRFNMGFLALMILSLVPWWMIFVVSRRSPWFYDLDQIVVRFVLLGALLAVLFNAPFGFWNLLGIRYLMLPSQVLVATCIGYMAGECWIIGGCRLPSDASVLRKGVRGACRWLALALPVLVLTAGGMNWATAEARGAVDIYRAVEEILDRMGERDILFTDGVLDDVIRLAARERRQPLTVLDVNKMDSPNYLKQQASQFRAAPVREALREGRIQAFLEALLQAENGWARVAILDLPDSFRPFGYLVPDALLYRLEADFSDEDLVAVAAGQRVFQEKMERLAARRVPKGNPLHGYHRVLLARASKLANNLGVMQAEAGCLEDAAATFRQALGMDLENLSARMNLMEVARRQGWPEWSEMEQDWPEWLNRGWPFRWALSMRYGYLWNAREWMKRGQAWAGSGMAMADEGCRRRDPVVDLREVERVQLIEQVYGQWGEAAIDETHCRNRLLQNDRDRHALRALFLLSLIRNDLEAAEAYLQEAAETGLDADLLAFDRAMLAYRREGREAAIRALKELVRENPSLDRGWLALALLAERQTATNRQAMKHLKNLPDGDVVFHTTVAWLQMAQGEWEAARRVLEAAARIQPRDRMTWEWMYILGQVQDNDRLVQTSRQTLVSGKPGHPLQALQDLFPLIRDRNWEAVESELRGELRQERHPELLNALGNLMAERGGEVSEAVAMIEEALVRQPFNPRFRCARAELMRKAGNMEEAIRDVQSVLELLPGHPLALLMMAEYHLDRGQREQAGECVRALAARESKLSPEHRARMRMLMKAVQP